jgi:pimeloyl-ACP methyl ester carboxylesterase
MTSLRLLIRSLVAAAGVVATTVGAFAQTADRLCLQENPAFGPDTRSTHVFTGEGTTPAGLECDTHPTDASALLCTGYLASELDGTRLDVAVIVPSAPAPRPLLVGMHGWGGRKESMADFDDDAIREGYTYLRYSARGFGKSWGQTNLADVNVEGADLRSLIGQVVDDPRFGVAPSDPNTSAPVAVFGASYGGAHAWMAAICPVFPSPEGRTIEIRTVVPIATWSELLYSLIPNGRPRDPITVPGAPKLSYIEALYFSGLRFDPERPYSNYPTYLHLWNAYIVASEPSHASPIYRRIVSALSGYRSIYWQRRFWENVWRQLPIFAVQGFTDDLFPVVEALRMYRRLRAIDSSYPIALYFGDVGHPRAANKSGEVEYGTTLILDWLAFHLKGDLTRQPAYDVKAAITRPAGMPFKTADVITARTWDALWTGTVEKAFPETAVIANNPADTSGVRWDPLLMTGAEELRALPPVVYALLYPPPAAPPPGAVATYTVPVAELALPDASLLVAGQPSVKLKVLTPSYRVQLNVRLIEVRADRSEHLVTRGTLTLDSGSPATPLGSRTVTIQTHGNLWEADRTSLLRLEITNVDSPYLKPSVVPSTTQISKVRLTVPVHDR